MKIALVVAAVLAAIIVAPGSPRGVTRTCVIGRAIAFASIRQDPNYLAGTIPSTFTTDQRFFSSRWSCKSMTVGVRRVTLGLYQLKFYGLKIRAVSGDALSDDGVASSVTFQDDTVTISLRGPLSGADVAQRRDVPFSVIVF